MINLQQPIDVTALDELEAKRRQQRRVLEKLQMPQLALETAQAELLAIEEQIEQARHAAQAAQQDQRQKESQIADLYHQRAALLRDSDLQAWARRAHGIRLRLVALGQDDPGDLVASAEAIAVPLLLRDDIDRTALLYNRATPAEVAAYRRRRELIADLVLNRVDHGDAEIIADLVIDEGIALDVARQRVLAPSEEDDTNDDTN